MLELTAKIMAKITIIQMNHMVMGVSSWLMKLGEKAITRQPSSVGKQLMTPHRISVNLLGGLMDCVR